MSAGLYADIRGNTVTASVFDCIEIPNDTDAATVADNFISGCGAAGIAVIGEGSRISHNNVSRNSGQGIYVEGSFNTIDQNSALENNSVGIDIVAGQKNTVVMNSATGNLFNGGVQNYFFLGSQNTGPITAAASATNPFSNTQ